MQFTLQTSEDTEQTLTGTWSDARFDKSAEVILKRIASEPELTEQALNIKGPAGQLSAALILPAGGNADSYPGVVFLHGSGPQPKDASRFAARELAKQGIAAVIFDKRGVGASAGDLAGVSFSDLADDGVAVAEYLSRLPEISAVGFFGHSQGGWIAPLAATKWKDTAFVISSAGPAVPPSREAHWDFVRKLRALGEDQSQVEKARQIIDYWHHGIRTGNWRQFEVAVKSASSQPWFESAGFNSIEAPPDAAFVESYSAIMDYDPIPTFKNLKVPLMAILAPSDESIDSIETEEILKDLIKKGSDIRIKLYPGVDHSMRTLGAENQLLRWPQHPRGYFTEQAEFIHEIVSES